MSRRAAIIAILFILGILFTLVAFAGAAFGPFAAQRVLPNVYTGDISLGGMTREQGVLRLQKAAEELKKQTVTLKCGNQAKDLSLKLVDVDVDCDAVMDRALKAGHSGPIWHRWSESRRIRSEGTRIPLVVALNQEKLKKQVDRLFAEITHAPVDASIRITPDDRVEIVPGSSGLSINHEVLYKDLVELLATGTGPYTLEVAQVNVPPGRTVEDLEAMGINGLLSTYTTRFDPGQIGRTYNVRVAAAALDGLLVAPEKEVSFNKVVGPRSTEAGYKNAKIIVDNEFVDGLGGGICQVSSTLYNAVLLADLNVTERSNHSLPVTYVPIGRDATVVYEYQDFCFRNNRDSYILIKSETGYNTLTFKIFGNTDNKPDVSIKSWVTEVIEPKVVYEDDSNLDKGEKVVKQKGARGYKTAGEITVTQDGKTITKPLPGSYYRPINKVVAVGTKETGSTIELPEEELPVDKEEDINPGADEENGSVDDLPEDNEDNEDSGETPNQDNAEQPSAEESCQIEIILP